MSRCSIRAASAFRTWQACDKASGTGVASRDQLYRDLLAQLDDPGALAARTKAALRQRIAFDAAPDGIFALDPIPRLLEAVAISRGFGTGIEQRLRALRAFLRDVYGDARMVGAGVVRPWWWRARRTSSLHARGAGRRWISVAGLDLVRGPDSQFVDQLRMPAGLAYAVVARETMRELLPVAPPQADHSRVFGELALALRDAAPGGHR